MLTSKQRREVIREMKADPPIAWPDDRALAEQFIKTAGELHGLEVDEGEARAAVARGRFRAP